ncbi:hypothetical protein H072_10904 [Dactylellina haptotyla CBS 200.50]|uniref:Uncharacterized protein n=1 Tax=Dactylellina haptotyla (strain CBS 200.50) TaxID=1284197 RepID=S8A3E9_DACHA|nr:hypothetical protein H072_10904 [Dactylellina haptotyla CBS 200.50]
MHSNLLAITTVIFLSYIEDVSAHVRFLLTYGNLDSKSQSNALGYRPDIPNYANGAQHPYQVDTTVFSSPMIPAWNSASPYYGKPRVWLGQGCGATLSNLVAYWEKMPQHWTPYGPSHPLTWVHRDIHFQMRPVDAPVLTQTKALITAMANAGRMCKVSPGGYLVIATFQINADGAGPFNCRIDETGTGDKFGSWLPASAFEQKVVEGAHSTNDWGTGKTHDMRIRIPKDIKCTAKYGNFENVCIMRCENSAPNGPFGGCVPFQVIYPKPPKVTTTITVTGPAPGTTTNVGSITDTVVITQTPKPTVTTTVTDEEPGTTTVTGSKTDTIIVTVVEKSTVTTTVTGKKPGTTTVTGDNTDTVRITAPAKVTVTKTVTDEEPGTTTVTGSKTDTIIVTVVEKSTVTTTVTGKKPGTTTVTGDNTDTVRITAPAKVTVTKTVTDEEPGTTTVTGSKTDTIIVTVVEKSTVTTTVTGKKPGTTTVTGDKTDTVRITATPGGYKEPTAKTTDPSPTKNNTPTPNDGDEDEYAYDNQKRSYIIRGRQVKATSVTAPKATTISINTNLPEPTLEAISNPERFEINGGKPESPPSQNPSNIKDPKLKEELKDMKNDMEALLNQAVEEHVKPPVVTLLPTTVKPTATKI